MSAMPGSGSDVLAADCLGCGMAGTVDAVAAGGCCCAASVFDADTELSVLGCLSESAGAASVADRASPPVATANGWLLSPSCRSSASSGAVTVAGANAVKTTSAPINTQSRPAKPRQWALVQFGLEGRIMQ